MSVSGVRVVCRFRPVNKREKNENTDDKEPVTLNFKGTNTISITSPLYQKPLIFTLDRVFHSIDTKQDEVYDSAAKDTVDDILKGYNGTVFAYGQTGSGKTFTMFGLDIFDPESKGIIPRACEQIFNYVKSPPTDIVEIIIKCSFLEIYMERVRDLLDPSKENLKIRETPTTGVWVEGLSEYSVTSVDDVLKLIRLGEKFRSVSETDMNSQSSRSHSLFIISIHQKFVTGTTQTGKLNLADLAGSEKIAKTGAKGDTLDEAKKINQSLSALGNVINALSTKKGHVPYRDSKLTFILRESLGGNCKTTLLVTCSPHLFNMDETISTLQFAVRAKFITNKVSANTQKSVDELNSIIEKLRKEITLLKNYIEILETELMKNGNVDLELLRQLVYQNSTKKQKRLSTSLQRNVGLPREQLMQRSQSISSNIHMVQENGNNTNVVKLDDKDNLILLAEAQVQLEKTYEREKMLEQELLSMETNLKEQDDSIEHLKNMLHDREKEIELLVKEREETNNELSKSKSQYEYTIQQLELTLASYQITRDVNALDKSIDKLKRESGVLKIKKIEDAQLLLASTRLNNVETELKESQDEIKRLNELILKERREKEDLIHLHQEQIKALKEAKLERNNLPVTLKTIVVQDKSMNIFDIFKTIKAPSSTLTTVKQGWLYKQGGFVKSWKKRWFTVKSDGLMYYYDKVDTEKGASPKGNISILKCVVNDARVTTQRENSFAIYDEDNRSRTFYLQAMNKRDYEEWTSFLKDYIQELSNKSKNNNLDDDFFMVKN